jgi:mevalonate kinase
MAVGDDWQSIYAFSGSILPLFTKFCEEVGYGQELKITRTYRNAQEIIDIAGTFVQKNNQQIKKELISPKRIDNPVIISTYGEDKGGKKETPKGGVFHNLGEAIENAIGEILDASHVSMRDDFEISVPQLDLAVVEAREAGAIGARMTGGGFGGAAIALTPIELVDEVTARVSDAFERAGFTAPEIFTVTPSDGAKREF